VLPVRLHMVQDIHEANAPRSGYPLGMLYSGSLKVDLRVIPHYSLLISTGAGYSWPWAVLHMEK
jgi:hypothetical protein